MNEQKFINELGPEDTQPTIQFSLLNFDSTDELTPLDEITGQPRAIKALEVGLGIRDFGFNIYMSGMSGMGRMALVKQVLKTKASEDKTPPDWIYVNNFDDPDVPLSISMKPGTGRELKKDMEELTERLREEVPRAFRQEDFTKEKQRLNMYYENQGREAFLKLEQIANQKNLLVQEMVDGRIIMIPKKDDRPMTPDEFESLSKEEKDAISKDQEEVGQIANTVLNQQAEFSQKLRDDVRQIERDFASKLIYPAIDKIAAKYEGEKLHRWLEKVKQHMIDNLQNFREKEASQQQMAMNAMLGIPPPPEEILDQYSVNVVVDNSGVKGAPVIFEESPNYKNLFGTIYGFFDRSGHLFTNYMNIRAGSILKANGGYIVFNLVDALIEPLVWKELKRTIRSGEHQYQMYDPFGVFATSSLRPEPIPLNIKLIVVGNPLLYHLFQFYDEDFAEIFKIKADFASELDGIEQPEMVIARFIRKLKDSNDLLGFDPGAVAELCTISTRMSGEKGKLTGEMSKLADIIREASFWAKQDKSSLVRTEHVQKAIDEKIYRSNLIAERLREYITNGTILLNVEGKVTGQINGLSVVQLGDYSFGRPTRVTASIGVGTAGIINIERESRLSGSSYDKAMMILEGYLRSIYATQHPISLSASITMEQSYGIIEGDSATIAELLCLLSAISGIPLRQDIAITGSVNQRGEIQAVGGIIQKVEGYFDVCKMVGLTGEQGVCIPHSNVRNLILRHDVVNAIREKKFHIWAISSVNEAIELLTGMKSGSVDEEGTFHQVVDSKFKAILNSLKEQKAYLLEREITPYPSAGPQQRDPRPRFPGEDKDSRTV